MRRIALLTIIAVGGISVLASTGYGGVTVAAQMPKAATYLASRDLLVRQAMVAVLLLGTAISSSPESSGTGSVVTGDVAAQLASSNAASGIIQRIDTATPI